MNIDLDAISATAGLDDGTGAVLWRDEGSMFGCDDRITLPHEPVRCRMRGRQHVTFEPLSVTSQGLDVALEGFDPRTGRTRWSVPAGASKLLAGTVERTPVAGEHTILADLPAGPRLVDLTDGRVTTPAPGAVFWCQTWVRFDFHEGYRRQPSPTEKYERNGGNVARPCDAEGKPAGSGMPSRGASRAVGALAGGYAVVATANGFRGIAVAG